MPHCSVPGCSEPNGHKFPTSKQQRMAWTIAMRREGKEKGSVWKPTACSRVCSKHFTPDDYISTSKTGKKSKIRKLKIDAVPSLKLPKEPQKTASAIRRDVRAKRKVDAEKAIATTACCDDGITSVYEELVESEEAGFAATASPCQPPSTESEASRSTRSSSCQTDPQPIFTLSSMNDTMIHFYTGLECKDKLLMVLHTLGPAQNSLRYYYDIVPQLSVPNQFLLTLTKLRRHQTNVELSMLFGIPRKQVSSIFITWINYMYYQWQEVSWWPDRETVSFHMPDSFKKQFPKTRLIIDGTEVKIQKPTKPRAQQCSFSTYKNCNTVKVMVGISPGGLVSYMSDAYAGSTSDRQIVERSDLHDICSPYDDIMSDKGFNVEDLFIPYHININIPTFFKKKNRMDGRTVIKDRKIAAQRVHVERVIGLGKTYKILRGPLDPVEVSLATEICFVVFTLCNFRNCIVK